MRVCVCARARRWTVLNAPPPPHPAPQPPPSPPPPPLHTALFIDKALGQFYTSGFTKLGYAQSAVLSYTNAPGGTDSQVGGAGAAPAACCARAHVGRRVRQRPPQGLCFSSSRWPLRRVMRASTPQNVEVQHHRPAEAAPHNHSHVWRRLRPPTPPSHSTPRRAPIGTCHLASHQVVFTSEPGPNGQLRAGKPLTLCNDAVLGQGLYCLIAGNDTSKAFETERAMDGQVGSFWTALAACSRALVHFIASRCRIEAGATACSCLRLGAQHMHCPPECVRAGTASCRCTQRPAMLRSKQAMREGPC